MAAVSAVIAVAVDVTEETADAGPAVREGASLSMAMATAVGDIVMSLAAAAVRGPGWVVGVWKCKKCAPDLRCHDIALTALVPSSKEHAGRQLKQAAAHVPPYFEPEPLSFSHERRWTDAWSKQAAGPLYYYVMSLCTDEVQWCLEIGAGVHMCSVTQNNCPY